MKRILFAFSLPLFLWSCSNKDVQTKESPEIIESNSVPLVVKGVDSLAQLTEIFLSSLQSGDSLKYKSYAFTIEQENAASERIINAELKKKFLTEFGFSLKEENVYFSNLYQNLQKEKIDLTQLDKKEIEYIDYSKADYAPLVLKEVFIPINSGNAEKDINFVAIQIDQKWYFTSEIGL